MIISFPPVPAGLLPTSCRPEDAARIQANFFTQVYGWMAAGLALTGGVALFTAASPAVQAIIFGNKFVFFGLIIARAAAGRVPVGPRV